MYSGTFSETQKQHSLDAPHDAMEIKHKSAGSGSFIGTPSDGCSSRHKNCEKLNSMITRAHIFPLAMEFRAEPWNLHLHKLLIILEGEHMLGSL